MKSKNRLNRDFLPVRLNHPLICLPVSSTASAVDKNYTPCFDKKHPFFHQVLSGSTRPPSLRHSSPTEIFLNSISSLSLKFFSFFRLFHNIIKNLSVERKSSTFLYLILLVSLLQSILCTFRVKLYRSAKFGTKEGGFYNAKTENTGREEESRQQAAH